MSAPNDLEDLGYGRGELRSAPAQSIRRIDVAMGRPVDINRAYASWSQQWIYYAQWTAFRSNPTAWRKANPGKPDPPLALHPDESWHCKGMAVDTDESPRTIPALADIWADNGWRFEVRSEAWHGQYYTSLDKNYGQPSGGGSTPFPDPDDPAPPTPDVPEDEDEDMAKNSGFKYTRSSDNKPIILLCNTTSRWWLEFQDVPAVVPTGVSGIAATMDTGTFAQVSEAWANAMKQSLDRA